MSVPVLSVAQMREWEQATWASGQTEAEVIRRVGQIVFDAPDFLEHQVGALIGFRILCRLTFHGRASAGSRFNTKS